MKEMNSTQISTQSISDHIIDGTRGGVVAEIGPNLISAHPSESLLKILCAINSDLLFNCIAPAFGVMISNKLQKKLI